MSTTARTLLITGASKGIGLAIAKIFLLDGYRVINLSRSPAPHKDIENHGIDLSDDKAEQKITALVSSELRASEICLVHNAAMLNKDSAASTQTSNFREAINLNVVAPHILNQHIIPLMAKGSSIIYIGSTLSEKAVPNTYSYIVSKHALVGMMRSTCQDLKGSDIHTNCICPGFTNTEMLRTHTKGDQNVLKDMAAMSTFNRLIDPAEIAATVKFAAQNPVINGAVLHANLGQIET